MPIQYGGGNELDRVLRQQFPKARKPAPGAKPTPPIVGGRGLMGLGDDDDPNQTSGSFPKVAYSGGPQTPAFFQGRQCAVRAPQSYPYNDPVTAPPGAPVPGVQPATPGTQPCPQLDNCCPTWMNPCCLDLLSKWLEQTLKNFQQHTRLPSHIHMPYRGIPIDIYPENWVSIPMGAYALPGAWINVVTYTIESAMRGSVAGLGQAVQDLNAWDDIEWRIIRDGVPLWPWLSIRYFQLWEFCPIAELQHRIHFYPNGTITIQARNWNQAANYNVIARIVGWKYPVRVEDGASIRATITD